MRPDSVLESPPPQSIELPRELPDLQKACDFLGLTFNSESKEYEPSTSSQMSSEQNSSIENVAGAVSADRDQPVDSWRQQVSEELRSCLRKKITIKLMPSFWNVPQNISINYLSQFAEYAENELYKVARSIEEHIQMVAAKIEMMKAMFEKQDREAEDHEPSGWVGLSDLNSCKVFPFVNSFPGNLLVLSKPSNLVKVKFIPLLQIR